MTDNRHHVQIELHAMVQQFIDDVEARRPAWPEIIEMTAALKGCITTLASTARPESVVHALLLMRRAGARPIIYTAGDDPASTSL